MPAIRRLRTGEASLYREIRLRSLQDSPAAFATTFESASARDPDSWTAQADAAAEGEDRALFVVLAGARPIGLAGLYRDAGHPACGELIQMWIDSSHRGTSLASELLDHLFAWASRSRFHSIRAEVTESNGRAWRFYEKYGFRPLSSGGDARILTKEVEPIPGNTSPAVRVSH